MNPSPFEIPQTVLAFFILVAMPTFGLWGVKNFIECWPFWQALKPWWQAFVVLLILIALTLVGTLGQAWVLHQPVDQDLLVRNILMALLGWLSSDWYKNMKQMVATTRGYFYWRYYAKAHPVAAAKLAHG